MTVQFTIDGVPEYALRSSMRDFRVPTGANLLSRCDEFFGWEDVRRNKRHVAVLAVDGSRPIRQLRG